MQMIQIQFAVTVRTESPKKNEIKSDTVIPASVFILTSKVRKNDVIDCRQLWSSSEEMTSRQECLIGEVYSDATSVVYDFVMWLRRLMFHSMTKTAHVSAQQSRRSGEGLIDRM